MTPTQLPLLASAPAGAARERAERLAGRVRLLSWLSLGWMAIEGGVAIAAGIAASSIALIGFGLDSVVEGVASLVIVWRFSGDRIFSERAERRAQKLVAAQFFLLAPYVAYESIRTLAAGDRPDASTVGIALAASSLILMPALGIAKQRLAAQLGSAATHGEGAQNLLCAYLAGALLLGLLGNAVLGAWWLDPAVALLIAAVAVKEGLETWQGDGCCAPAAPATCALELPELRLQRDRYARIGQSVSRMDRGATSLAVALDPTVDDALVAEALTIERDCCPFFRLDYDPNRHLLAVAVDDPAHAPALEAIATALKAAKLD